MELERDLQKLLHVMYTVHVYIMQIKIVKDNTKKLIKKRKHLIFILYNNALILYLNVL